MFETQSTCASQTRKNRTVHLQSQYGHSRPLQQHSGKQVNKNKMNSSFSIHSHTIRPVPYIHRIGSHHHNANLRRSPFPNKYEIPAPTDGRLHSYSHNRQLCVKGKTAAPPLRTTSKRQEKPVPTDSIRPNPQMCKLQDVENMRKSMIIMTKQASFE